MQKDRGSGRDVHGFLLAGPAHRTLTKELLRRIRIQEEAWHQQAKKRGLFLWWPSPSSSSSSTAKKVAAASNFFSRVSNSLTVVTFKKLVWKGIPPSLRPIIWMSTSGAAEKQSHEPPSYYQNLCEDAETASSSSAFVPTFKQIECDIARTFPTHMWVSSPQGKVALGRVLKAYAMRDIRVGYCQGMNFIVGMLLVAMEGDEESAFWMLATLIENILFKDCYTADLFGCHQQCKTVRGLLHRHRPRIAKHLDSILDFDVGTLVLDWMLCLYAKSLEAECTLRIWDILFTEASVDILFGVALTIFYACEAQLLAARSTCDVIDILRGRAGIANDLTMKSATDDLLLDIDMLIDRALQNLSFSSARAYITHCYQTAKQWRAVQQLSMAQTLA